MICVKVVCSRLKNTSQQTGIISYLRLWPTSDRVKTTIQVLEEMNKST